MDGDLFSCLQDAPQAAAAPCPAPPPAAPAKAAPRPVCAPLPLPSMQRIAELAKECGALAADSSEEARTQAIAQTLAKLLQEVQAAPAGLPPATRVLCWVMDSELAKFAPLRVIRALQPYAVSNGELMYPLYVPASSKGVV